MNLRYFLDSTKSIKSFFYLSTNRRTFASINNNEEKKIIKFIVSDPISTIRNYIWGHLIRGYFKQDFHLKDFLEACPYAITQVVDILKSKQLDELDDVSSAECKRSLVNSWNKIDILQKRSLENLKVSDFSFIKPQIRMRMPKREDEDAEIPAFLNIKMLMIIGVDCLPWNEYLNNGSNNAQNKFIFSQSNIIRISSSRCILIFPAVFEREVTRYKEDTWKIEDLGSWPVPFK